MLDTLKRLLKASSRPGRGMDRILGIDATGFGTSKAAIWILQKYFFSEDAIEKRTKYRKGFVKVHTVAGLMSGLIYSLSCTLKFGEGTADVKHLPDLVRRALNPNVKLVVGDKAYWDDEHYGALQDLGIMLMVMIKEKVNPDNAEFGRETMAFMEFLRREHPAIYRTFHRYRQRMEGVFSSEQRVSGHIKSRTRKAEMKRLAQKYPAKGPTSLETARELFCTFLAQELVGTAQTNEAYGIAIAHNARRIAAWEYQLREPVSVTLGTNITSLRRIILPYAS